MNKTMTLTTLVLSLAVGGNAFADRFANHRFDDRARVLSATPLYEEVRIPHDEEVCWNEQVTERYPAGRGHGSYTPTLIGALAGGLVGNQFGHASGKTAMTAAGALLGGSIGRDMGDRPHYPGVRHLTERRCEVRTTYEIRDERVGYDVEYEYEGRRFHTRTHNHPGDWIRVDVAVRPNRH